MAEALDPQLGKLAMGQVHFRRYYRRVGRKQYRTQQGFVRLRGG